jgi:hypothetical protein
VTGTLAVKACVGCPPRRVCRLSAPVSGDKIVFYMSDWSMAAGAALRASHGTPSRTLSKFLRTDWGPIMASRGPRAKRDRLTHDKQVYMASCVGDCSKWNASTPKSYFKIYDDGWRDGARVARIALAPR